jgi:hypothetical protein
MQRLVNLQPSENSLSYKMSDIDISILNSVLQPRRYVLQHACQLYCVTLAPAV